ncbi:MAG TPA: right-handed parallel beta-helix repeat-containing protein [Acidimicrobiales bacterium]|nr:right-handed parallel beta-helix repeat-containing protein [Acidimicrobiales bacterium]
MALTAGSLAGLAMATTSAAAAAGDPTWYVAPSPTGSGTSGGSCAAPGFNTIAGAVAAAASGDTVDVCPGTYTTSVTISGKAITLNGSVSTTAATIEATGLPEGIVVEGAAAAGSTVEGFTVTGSAGEGILVEGTTDVAVSDNTVTGNDTACVPETTENDCGEGIHLEAVTDSIVSRNTSEDNSGGILLDDGVPAGSIGVSAFGGATAFSGPTSGNVVVGNIAVNNVWDCGITLPSHNSLAAPGGVPDPSAGGVFDNTVEGNVSENNGIDGGGGSGVLVAAPFPGTAAYSNTIEDNIVQGNGQAGITIHSHAPAQDTNGNQIIDNTVGQNAVGESVAGTGVFSTGSPSAGDSDAGDPATTGILVYSAVDHLTGTVIQGNAVSGNYYGIWTSNTDTSGISANTFSGATVATYAEPAPGSGYVLAGSDGGIFALGSAPFWGSAPAAAGTVVGLAETSDGGGYWVASSTGAVANFGDAAPLGSLAGKKLVAPVVGIAGTPDGHGYWLVASDGGVFGFGDAAFHGSMGGKKLVKPVVGMAGTPDGGGYWLVASDGGVFSFGDAAYHGSMGGKALVKPVVGLAPTADGGGYWEVASDGGVFSFGDATYRGSLGGKKLDAPVVGIAAPA